jgi:hypothetical protein
MIFCAFVPPPEAKMMIFLPIFKNSKITLNPLNNKDLQRIKKFKKHFNFFKIF